MWVFDVAGPYLVPCYEGKAGRVIDRARIAEFWNQHKNVAGRRGCYLFGIRAGRGYTPIYVGKATKTFQAECYTYHKLDHYHRCLVDYARGTPVMFFVLAPRKRGRANASMLKDVEQYLITVAETANPELSNVQGRAKHAWGIRGVIRGGKGKPGAAIREFKRLVRL